ncbi:hypothetical protein K8O93_00780 [Gordonia bronchialis]|uniref:hypothetical protein n=1 Tax=Gordonia bronchialis TaxID=2054 RepID=UPI001CBF7520|nr:hypothetical protein [Gordonia bronchialis]UAK38368.1 hypothetical protein K8O93_00780 [Gordonia bronchialis]
MTLLDQLKDYVADQVSILTGSDDEILPLFAYRFGEGDDEVVFSPIMANMGDAATKDKLCRHITASIAVTGATEAFVVFSSWMLETTEPLKGPVSEHPDRVEVVTLFEATPGEGALHTAKLTHNPPTLGEWQCHPSDVDGRFAEAMADGFIAGAMMPTELRERAMSMGIEGAVRAFTAAMVQREATA